MLKMKMKICKWHAVAAWTWGLGEDVCGICQALPPATLTTQSLLDLLCDGYVSAHMIVMCAYD